MRNKFLNITLCCAAIIFAQMFSSCGKIDEVRKKVSSLENRMTALEAQVNTLNENVKAVSALLNAGTINKVEEKDGVYTITLSDGKTIRLDKGSVGVANPPVISVDDEGYWMVDYQDGKGKNYLKRGEEKIKARGEDGKTPVFGVDEQGYWTVSYDEGKNFKQIKDASGNPVKALPSGEISDPYFKEVSFKDNVFKLVLKDGRSFTLPVIADFLCKIEGAESVVTFAYLQTKEFALTMKGVSNIVVYAPEGWKAAVEGGKLKVTAPAKLKSVVADTKTDVSVLAVSNSGYSAIAKLKVELSDTPAPVEPDNDLYTAYNSGKTISIAGVSYDKSTYGEPKLITAAEAETDIKGEIHKQSGVFFLEQNANCVFDIKTVAEISGKVILLSRYADKPVTVRPSANLKLEEGEFVMKNLVFDMAKIIGGTNLMYAFSNSNATADMDRLHIEDCRILNVRKSLLYANDGAKGFGEIVMENCKVQLVTGASENLVLFNLYKSTVLEKYKKISFKNNVLFNSVASAFQLLSYDQNQSQTGTSWELEMSMENNILYNLPGKNGLLKFYKLKSLSFKNNVLWAEQDADIASYCLILYSDGMAESVLSVSDNIAFGLKKPWTVAHGKSTIKPNPNVVEKLTEDPFENFVKENGDYKLKAAYSAHGPKQL